MRPARPAAASPLAGRRHRSRSGRNWHLDRAYYRYSAALTASYAGAGAAFGGRNAYVVNAVGAVLPVSLPGNRIGRPVTLGKQYALDLRLAGNGRSLVVYSTDAVAPVSTADNAATRLIVPRDFFFPAGLAVAPDGIVYVSSHPGPGFAGTVGP